MIGALCNSKDVGWDFIPPLGTVDTDSSHGVDGEPLVGVDSDTEEARVGVDQPLHVAHLQVKEDRGVIEVGQVGHVLAAVILGRVDLGHQLLLERLILAGPGALGDLHLDLVPSCLLDETLAKLLLGMGNIARSFRVVSFLRNLLLQFIANEEIRSGIWIWLSSIQYNLGSWHFGCLLLPVLTCNTIYLHLLREMLPCNCQTARHTSCAVQYP